MERWNQKGKCIDLQKLSLKICDISVEELAAVSTALAFIKKVNLSKNQEMGTEWYAELAKAIVQDSGEAEQKGKCIDLKKLSLKICAISVEELAALSPALAFKKEVDLSMNVEMGMQGYAELAKAIVQASREAEQKGKCIDLQKLRLRNCLITAEELTALSQAVAFIKEVDLSMNVNMETQGYAELAKAIVQASREVEQKGKCIDLQKLSLKTCDISVEELAALSPALGFIKEVNLSGNPQMGMQGYAELAKAIVQASREAEQKGKCIDLQKLSLRNCFITAEELAALSQAVAFIKEIDLSINVDMGMQRYAELAKPIVQASREAEQKGKCIDLQKLSLKTCDISVEELAALSPALAFIKEVNLSGNPQMGMQGYAELAKAIVQAS